MERDSDQIEVNVLFFSVIKEALERSTMKVSLGRGSNAGALLDQLANDHAIIRDHRAVIRLAVNTSYAKESVALNDGDEVALITPVSGG